MQLVDDDHMIGGLITEERLAPPGDNGIVKCERLFEARVRNETDSDWPGGIATRPLHERRAGNGRLGLT